MNINKENNQILKVVKTVILIFTSWTFINSSLKAQIPDKELLFQSKNSPTRIVLLGTGTPNAEPHRSGPAVAIIVNEIPYLIDCGPGVVRRSKAAYQKGINALDPVNLKRLFITHLHSDHTLGYPDLIFTPWVLGRNSPLEVYGPPGIKSMTRHIQKAYKKDIKTRVTGLEPANTSGYRVRVHNIKSGLIYQDHNVAVKAFPVSHGSWDYAFGFRFETPDKVVIISGDCTPSPLLLANSHNCDVLIHEVYSQEGFKSRSSEWQKYHQNSHTSSIQLAEIAGKIRPKLVILYHQLLWGSTPEELLKEIQLSYQGRVVYGNDLDIF